MTHRNQNSHMSAYVQKGVKGISILEAMAASGLRAIRYAKEIPGVGQVVANDMDEDAVKAIKRNIELNDVCDTVTAYHGDARLLMLQHPQVQHGSSCTAPVSGTHCISRLAPSHHVLLMSALLVQSGRSTAVCQVWMW